MTASARLAAFVAALAAVFALAFGLGRAVGPDVEHTPSSNHVEHESAGEQR